MSHVTVPYCLHGISHNKIEDTKEEYLAMAVTAFDKLAEKAMGWIERSGSE
jgi:beta-ureidopropionase / N-carbamoyl-L-amino-acid hydrolase